METKKRIMDTAFKLFAVKGTGFSLNEIAKDVGIQKASIYAHFSSKEELLFAVIDREINQYFYEINEHCTSLEGMFYMILNYYDRSKTKLYFWKRLLLFPPEVFKDTLTAKINELSAQRFELVKSIIASDIELGRIHNQDIEAAAFSFTSQLHGLLSSMIIYESEDFTKHFENIWKIFYQGIKGGTQE